MKPYTLYLDMDGVLADFYKVVDTKDKKEEKIWLKGNFFRHLPIINNPKDEIPKLQKRFNVKILSKVETRDSEYRIFDKIQWVVENIPSIGIEDIIIVPIEKSKTDFVKSDFGFSILVDDFEENLKEWRNKGGLGIKFKKGSNIEINEFLTVGSLLDI